MSAFERRLNSISYRIISQRQFRVGLRVQFIDLGYHLLVK